MNELIKKQLQSLDMDVVDVIAIPGGDRVKRLKALQEVLISLSDSVEQSSGEFLVRLRRNEATSYKEFPFIRGEPLRVQPELEAQGQRQCLGEIYLPSGKLNIPYLMRNADLLFEAGDHPSARKIYSTILKSGEFTSAVLQRLGRCYEAEGKLDRACAVYEESITYQPSLEGYQRLAAVLVSLNKDQEAAEVMDRALKLKDLLPGPGTEQGNQQSHRPVARLQSVKARG